MQFKNDLFGTEKEIKQPEFVRKRRQGFGIIIAPINLAIDDLLQGPPMWRDDVPLFQQMETAKGYIAKHSPISKPTNTSSPQTTPAIANNTTTNTTTTSPTTTSTKQATQVSNLPQTFSSPEAWHRYIKKTIGTYGFLDNTDLESSSKFAGTINNGCYFCRMNNHTHLQCGPLNEYKRLDIVAKESTDTSTVSARTNHTKDEQGVTYDMGKDNISSDNVKPYVVSSLDKNIISSNILSSFKTTNSYCTLPDNNITNVNDGKYNLFTTSQVSNFLKPEHAINKKNTNTQHLQQQYKPNKEILTQNTSIKANNIISPDSRVDIFNTNTIQRNTTNHINNNKIKNNIINKKIEHNITSNKVVKVINLVEGGGGETKNNNNHVTRPIFTKSKTSPPLYIR